MSIATLKKKINSSYKIVSSGERQFSLNGSLRNQGYVGQTSLSRTLLKTPMKGNAICGYGGCCGTFNIYPVIQSAVVSLNNAAIIKPSVLGTSGLISTKYQWTRRPAPFTAVKPDNSIYAHNFVQSDYISYLKHKTICKTNDCNATRFRGLIQKMNSLKHGYTDDYYNNVVDVHGTYLADCYKSDTPFLNKSTFLKKVPFVNRLK